MAKKIKTIIKLALTGGKATPAPPVGPALGQHGINIANFCKEYNAKTQEFIGSTIPVKLTIYDDKSYSFVLKSSPTSVLIKQLINIKKGAAQPNKQKLGVITNNELEKIARIKLVDLNTKNLTKAMSMIAGTAKNMGIDVVSTCSNSN